MTRGRVAAKTILAAADLVVPALEGPRILIYHQVGSGRSHEMNIPTTSFRRQLDWLQSHGEILSLEDALARRSEPDSHNYFVLTFDDGYEDVYRNAFPILEERRIPFTLYLTSGPIDVPADFPSWPGQPLGWGSIRSMIESGLVTVGAHTHRHPDLRHISQGEIADELDRSNDLIAIRSGISPLHFTYPKGWWAPHAHQEVQMRYKTATLGGGESITATSDLHLLHRVPVQRSDSGPLFARKMHTGGRMEDRLRRRLRGYEGP
jgi:peptidoglycan/xylan/chitin deacetylase (PgdA/CDA1 family)